MLVLVVIQPTSFCNLNCDYCYLSDRQLKNRLSLDLIEPILKTFLISPFVGGVPWRIRMVAWITPT